jgi:glucokinase
MNVLGVDIGGTKVAAGVVNESGEILEQFRAPMSARGTAEEGFASVAAAIDGIRAAGAHFESIGIVSPGPLDPTAGVVVNPPNVPCWRNYPLTDAVHGKYGLATFLDNDANAAGLAEALWGAGRGYSQVFYATLGTGIGTGMIFDGRIFHGRTGAAAEGGHVTIDYNGPRCGCGKRGCIEVLASGPAIAQRARTMLAGAKSGALLRLAKGEPGGVTTELVADAFRAGDPVATAALRQTAELLAIWLGNIIDLLEPDVIVIGGGVSDLMSGFFAYIKELLPQWSINQRCTEIPLVRAHYGADAGIAGAAALCFANRSNAKAGTQA